MDSRPNLALVNAPYDDITVRTNKSHVPSNHIIHSNGQPARSVNLDQLIYIASPYHHQDAEVMENRYVRVAEATAHFMRLGYVVYSPIAHTHSIAEWAELPRDFSFYEQFDLTMISRANEVWVLLINGWEQSKGVRAELEFCQRMKVPFRFIFPKAGEIAFEVEYLLTQEITDWHTPIQGIYDAVNFTIAPYPAVMPYDNPEMRVD